MARSSNSFMRKNQLVCDHSWIQTFILSVASMLPWFVGYLLPAFRSMLCELGPQFWQLVLECFTQPLLFFVVNVVILSIWFTSRISAAALSDDTRDALEEIDETSSPVISSTHLDKPLSPPAAPSRPPAPMNISPYSILAYDPSTGIKAAVTSSPAESEMTASIKKRAAAGTCSQAGGLLQDKSLVGGSSGEYKNEATVDTGRRLLATNSLKPAGGALKVKLERRRSSTLPRVASHVNMLRDDPDGRRAMAVECGLNRKEKMELVMDKDELKERIDLFFAKFREQMRQDSLRQYQ